MPDDSKAIAPIIIFKKKKGHGGHHGGAWKVAYADFVTAMMALFIVLWLLNSSVDVRKAIGGYFQDPSGVGKQIGSAMAGTGEVLSIKKDDMPKLMAKLSEAISVAPDFKKLKNQVQMLVTGQGLRIELLETDQGAFFESGRPAPTALGSGLIAMLAGELGKMPNRLVIEGHTDSKPFSGAREYGNWELSADRANAARRLMEANGVRPGQIAEIRGFADQQLRKPKEPENPGNRRVSVIVQYQSASDQAGNTESRKDEKKEEAHTPKKAGKVE